MLYFTVVITTYNRSDIITEAILSVLEQSFTDFEILLIDDGSNDDTKETIGQINDNRFNYYYQENSERGAARNSGIRKAKGHYIVFLDSDDIMMPNHLALLHASIIKNPTIQIFASRYEFFDDNGIIKNSALKVKSGIYDKSILLEGNPFAVNFCIQNDFSSLKFFEESRTYSIMEDWMFLVENLASRKLFVLPEITIRMRDHKNRSMRGIAKVLSEKRILATHWIENKNIFSKKELVVLWAGSYRFSAIHYYIDGNRSKALYYWAKMIKISGINISITVLLLKIIVGKKIIRFISK